MVERRRSVRVGVGHGSLASLPAALNVQVLDISVIGVLLHSSREVDPGARGSLRLNLAGAPFSADIEVRRVLTIQDDGGRTAFRVGARFVGISSENRQLIERFAGH